MVIKSRQVYLKKKSYVQDISDCVNCHNKTLELITSLKEAILDNAKYKIFGST